jgi:phosphoribosylamine--glycine ligase
MKVLVIGSGGREHALAWKLAQSPQVERVYAAPGNGGTAGEMKCQNVPVPGGDPSSEEGQEALLAFALGEKIALTVVGPEAPLAAGLVDRFRGEALAVIGPDKSAARLEASKAYAKTFMNQYGVRTARSRTFSAYEPALHYAQKYFTGGVPALPLAVKADGLAAGMGVVIAADRGEAEAALGAFMREGSLGEAGKTVVLEEFLEGREVSVLAAVSVSPGKAGFILPFVSARDHKRRFDGGRGPNTGGMGAIAPAPDFSPEAQQDFNAQILKPTLRGLEQEGLDYRGFIFFGLMVKDNRCSLLEYNVRLGDPETQAVLPLLEGDLAELCLAIQEGRLGNFPLAWKEGAVCAPVAVAAGYPGPYRKGDLITVNREGLDRSKARLFIAGAEQDGEAGLRSSGGRVLAASAWGPTAEEARRGAYQALEALDFEGMDYRKDIGREQPEALP